MSGCVGMRKLKPERESGPRAPSQGCMFRPGREKAPPRTPAYPGMMSRSVGMAFAWLRTHAFSAAAPSSLLAEAAAVDPALHVRAAAAL